MQNVFAGSRDVKPYSPSAFFVVAPRVFPFRSDRQTSRPFPAAFFASVRGPGDEAEMTDSLSCEIKAFYFTEADNSR